jgi:hypothetical protein
LWQAWSQVARKKCPPGVDGVGVCDFGREIASHLTFLLRRLRKRTYRPLPYRITAHASCGAKWPQTPRGFHG